MTTYRFLEPINRTNLYEDLREHFSNYDVYLVGSTIVEIKKDDTTAVKIEIDRNKMFIHGDHPEGVVKALFILLGFVLLFVPFLINFIAFRPAQKRMESEVCEYIVFRSKKLD